MQILSRIAERLEYLHAHGYVHRDLKPSTVLWLHHTGRWSLTELTTAARTAEPAVPPFTLCYSAPELCEELQMGAKMVAPQPAQDVWALGVIAIELLTGSPAFDLTRTSFSQVRFQVCISRVSNACARTLADVCVLFRGAMCSNERSTLLLTCCIHSVS